MGLTGASFVLILSNKKCFILKCNIHRLLGGHVVHIRVLSIKNCARILLQSICEGSEFLGFYQSEDTIPTYGTANKCRKPILRLVPSLISEAGQRKMFVSVQGLFKTVDHDNFTQSKIIKSLRRRGLLIVRKYERKNHY